MAVISVNSYIEQYGRRGIFIYFFLLIPSFITFHHACAQEQCSCADDLGGASLQICSFFCLIRDGPPIMDHLGKKKIVKKQSTLLVYKGK